MKIRRYSTIIILICFTSLSLMGQEKKFEHKIVAGFNWGASAPIPIPSEVRSVKAWWPQFNPQLGYNIIYNINDKWGIGSGIMLDYKGMGVKDRVKYMYTSIYLTKEDNIPLEGYFTGTNETRTRMAYTTIPVYATYKLNDKWNIRAGGYASYLSSGEFKGDVSDGYMRVKETTGEKIEIDEATFDFNDKLRKFDFGVTLGTEFSLNQRFGLYGNLNWGLISIFPSDFKAMGFKMYNIYFVTGMTYNL